MAATVSIVVRAINATKAVFQDVGTQAEALNKRMKYLSSLFRGLFVAGIAAKFIKELLNASTYAKELEQASSKVKSAWKSVGTDIGDALASAFISLEPIFSKAGKIAKAIVDDIRYAAAYAGSISAGATKQDAKKQATEEIDRIKREQEYRKERQKTDDRIREAIERNNKAAEDYDKLKADNDAREIKAQEDKLKNDELLVKKLQEQIDLGGELANLEQMGLYSWEDATKAEKIRKSILDLDEQIVEIRKKIADQLDDEVQAELDAYDEAQKKYKNAEKEKLNSAQDRIKQTTKLEIDALEKEADAYKQSAQEKEQKAQDLLEKAAGEGERRYRLKKAGITIIGGPSEKSMKAEAERLQKQAAEEMAKAEESRKNAEKAQLESEKHLKSIDERIQQLLALKE